MTEHEKVIIEPLINDGTIAFYTRYVDDTLVLIKPENIEKVLEKVNSFHPKLNFTVDKFSDGDVHFLDLRITEDINIDVYRKDTFTGQYSHFDSFEPWYYKIAWARSIYSRCRKLCSTPEAFRQQVRILTSYLSWNGFPRHVSNSLIRKFKMSNEPRDSNIPTPEETNEITIWFKLPYMG